MPHVAKRLGDLTRDESVAAFEVAEIAGSGLPTLVAVGAMFDVVARLVPVCGLSLSIPNPLAGGHRTVASRGYSHELLAFLDSGYLRKDSGYGWMRRTGSRYGNWLSPDFDYSTSNSARDWFKPAGFSGGSTNHLLVRDRYIGELHISTDDPKWPTPRSLSVLDLMSPLFSAVTSEVVLPQRLLENEPDGTCGALCTGGGTVALPGRPSCKLLQQGSPLVELVRSSRLSVPTLGAKRRWHDGEDWQQVTLLPTIQGLILMHRPQVLPHGLTARELEVITLVATGTANHSVARRLGIATSTACRHIERIMEKLGVSDRVSVTRIAHDEGLLLL